MWSYFESSLNHSSGSMLAGGSNGSNKIYSVFTSTAVDGIKTSFTSSPQMSRSHSPMAAIRWALKFQQFYCLTDN